MTKLTSSNEPEGSDGNRWSTNRRRAMTILTSSQMNLKAQMITDGRLTDDGPWLYFLTSSQMNLKAQMVTDGRLTDDGP